MSHENDETQTTKRVKSIHVLLWNVWLLPWTPNPPFRAKEMRKMIMNLPEPQPDVIIFNEAFSQHDILFSDEFRGKYPHSVRLGRQYWTIFSGGVWIFSKFPIVYSNSFHYSGRRGVDWFAAKGVLLARIQVPKSSEEKKEEKEEEKREELEESKEEFYEVDIYGTHMQGGFEPSMAAARKTHVSEIIQFVKKESSSDSLIVFGGDINMGPPSDPPSWHYHDAQDAEARTGEYCRMRDTLEMKELDIYPKEPSNISDINRFLYRGFPQQGEVHYIPFEDVQDESGKKVPLSDTACLMCSISLP